MITYNPGSRGRGATMFDKRTEVCKSHTGGITAVAIGENGQTLCTASMDKSLRWVRWTSGNGWKWLDFVDLKE